MDTVLQELIDAAQAAMHNAYCPYSGYSVGAAVMSANGDIYTGCNVESASYGATVCAERAALCAATVAGARALSAVAVVSSGSTPYPCGICRQMLSELAPEAVVFMKGRDGRIIQASVKELLPYAFELNDNKP
ncbi:MAG: cytidine deaminase [Firmicutes bacterium]|nr:cytidine deaminase [Bacillota bacterium]